MMSWRSPPPCILVLGASSFVGFAVFAELPDRGRRGTYFANRLACPLSASWTQLDVLDGRALEATLRSICPSAIIDCTMPSTRDACLGARHATNLVAAVQSLDVWPRVVYLSTDAVFDGNPNGPHSERRPARARSPYAQTKLAAEQALQRSGLRGVIVRTGPVFGRDARPNDREFDGRTTRLLDDVARGTATAFADQWKSPSFLDDLVKVLISAARGTCTGVHHAGSGVRMSRLDFARRVAVAAGFAEESVRPEQLEQQRVLECFGRDTSLQITRPLITPGNLDQALRTTLARNPAATA